MNAPSQKADTNIAAPDDAELADTPGKRAQTKIRNRQLILQAAKHVFASIGYDAATVRDIIHATPLASGTFYNYFKSKDDIYRAIYDEAAKTIRPMVHAQRSAAKNADEFIRGSVKTYYSYIMQEWKDFYGIHSNRANTKTRFEVPEVCAASEDLRDDLIAAMDRGIIPRTDVDYLTMALLSLCMDVAGVMLRRQDPDPDAAIEFVCRFILQGIMALPPAPGADAAKTAAETPPA